jgi:hypothetical protein
MSGNILMSSGLIWRTNLPLGGFFFLNNALGTIFVFTGRVANFKAMCYQIRFLL